MRSGKRDDRRSHQQQQYSSPPGDHIAAPPAGQQNLAGLTGLATRLFQPVPWRGMAGTGYTRRSSMHSVFLCHASSDAATAAGLKKFLEAGTCCEIEARPLPDGETVASYYDHGGTDSVILLLSPRSVPTQWSVEEWQGVLDELDNNTLASVVVTPCRKPQRLERRNYFESDNLRGVKQWVLARMSSEPRISGLPSAHPSYHGDEAEMNVLRCAVGDRPGRARLTGNGATLAAIDFAHRFVDDFERIVWSHCGDGTPEGAASDIAMRLGLPLSGPLESDIEKIEAFLATRRYLLVLDDPPAGFLEDTVKTSVIVTGGAPGFFHYEHEFHHGLGTPNPSLVLDAVSRLTSGCTAELAAELAATSSPTCEDLFREGALLRLGTNRFWAPNRSPRALTLSDATAIMRYLVKRRDPEDLPNAEVAIRRALRETDSDEWWNVAKALKSVACSVAREHGQVVEVHALVSLLEPYARARADMKTQEECLRERRWIEESWGGRSVSAAREDLRDRQLELEL